MAITFASVMIISSGGSLSNDGEPDAAEDAMGVVNGAVAISGTALPTVPQAGADPALGRAFPSLQGTNLFNGSPLTIGADGRPKIVIFVAHWCPHCQAEVPVITQWMAEHGKPHDVDLYAVSTAVAPERGNFPPASWLQREKWPIPTMADTTDGNAFKAAGLTGFPSFVVLDAAGNVLSRPSGELSTRQFELLLAQARS